MIGDLSKIVGYVIQDSGGKDCFAGFTQVVRALWRTCTHWLQSCFQSEEALNYRNTSYDSLESWYNSSVLLTNLLDVNSRSGKNIHQLRVLSALLITVPETEISIVSPCVHLCWVCNEKANTVGSIAS